MNVGSVEVADRAPICELCEQRMPIFRFTFPDSQKTTAWLVTCLNEGCRASEYVARATLGEDGALLGDVISDEDRGAFAIVLYRDAERARNVDQS